MSDSPVIERCEQCGRMTRITGNYHGLALNGFYASQWCSCPPGKPTKKHDGNLGGPVGMDARIEYFDVHPPTALLALSGGYGLIESTDIMIDPTQALSLLAWLRQEEATLTKLAEEQAQ